MPSPEGFPRSARLLEPRDYKRVFAKPIRSTDRLFVVLASANPETGPRLGLAIAKKQVRRAFDRNRVKRQARESFRRHRGELPEVDFVILARRDTARGSNRQLAESLALHWKRLAGQCRKS